jgi:DNA polymerase III epsilon subunit-like protein
MKLLIFDTETTGLPKSRKSSTEGANNWPHIVSISWVILDSETNVIEKEQSYIVKPEGWTIPEESIRIHRITNEMAEKDGVPLSRAIGEFLAETYDALVAHNMEFDYNVLDNAIRWDLKMAFNEIRKPKLCTMELGRNICKLKTLFGKPKAPKLSELYMYAFGTAPDMDTLHNSLVDTKLLVKIVQECKPLRVKMNLTESDGYIQIKNARQKSSSGVLSIRLG